MKTIKILTILCLGALVLQAQDITNKLGGNTASETYDVTDSADNLLFRVQGDGKVGIGTTTPSTKLQIYDGVDNAHIILQDINTGTGPNQGAWLGFGTGSDLWIWNAENTDLKFGTNSETRMTIDNDGNVGIGTLSPLSKLSVGGNGIANAAIFGDGTIGGAITHYGGYFTADEMEGIGLYVSGHYRSGIFNGGPLVVQYTLGVGIPDPQANLDVHGTVKMFGAWDNSTYTRDVVYQATTDGTVHASFRTNGSGVAIIGKTDASTPPTTARVVEGVPDLGDIAWVSITMSVKKGDYWTVIDEGTNVGEEIINWIPLGQ